MGTYRGSLFDLCELADGVVEEMGTYDLVESNCQHFCNNLLKKLYKRNSLLLLTRIWMMITALRFVLN